MLAIELADENKAMVNNRIDFLSMITSLFNGCMVRNIMS